MNDEPFDTDQSGGDAAQLDELLSADLDGELETAARDLGLGTGEAAELIASEHAQARRRSIAGARELLAEPVEIDELLAARLRAKAVRVARTAHEERSARARGRMLRVLGTVAGIAAAAVVVVGVVAVIGNGGGASSSKSASMPLAATPTRPATTAPRRVAVPLPGNALGAFTDRHTLAENAVAQSLFVSQGSLAEGDYATANGPASSGAGAATPLDTATHSTAASSSSAQAATAKSAATACPTTTPAVAGDTPVLRTTATLSGKPVVVLVYAHGSAHAVVLQDTSCRLLGVEMVG